MSAAYEKGAAAARKRFTRPDNGDVRMQGSTMDEPWRQSPTFPRNAFSTVERGAGAVSPDGVWEAWR